MSGAGIHDGDYAVVRRQKTAENGEITAVLLGDEATVKRFFHEKEGIRLQPENEAFQPIITREAEILGKVVALFRRL
jgi:repressor LexA